MESRKCWKFKNDMKRERRNRQRVRRDLAKEEEAYCKEKEREIRERGTKGPKRIGISNGRL